MNKLLLTVLLVALPVNSFAAQQQLQTRANTTSPSVDTNFTRQQAMNTDLYTNKADKSTLASKSAFFTAFGWDTGVSDYASLTNKPTIPSALADLSADSTHRVVTDAEKTTWNGKANTSAFESPAAFQDAFGWSPSGTFDTTADQTITGDWAFSSGLEASNISLNLGTLADLKIGNAQMVDDTKGNGDTNFLWSAKHTFDQLATKQATLVSGTNIKTINGNSLVGSGDLTISGGSGTSGYVALSAPPYSDVACTTGQYGYYGSTAYLCTGGFWASKWTLTAHSNPSPVTYSLTITPSGFTGADKFTYGGSNYTTQQAFSGLTADASFTVTPDTGRAITCAGTGLTDNTGGSYTANTDTANVAATCTSSASGGISDDFNRADGAIGSSYTAINGSLTISGNKAVGSAWVGKWMHHNTALGSNDHWVQGDIEPGVSSNTEGSYLGVRSNGTTGYVVHLYAGSPGSIMLRSFNGATLSSPLSGTKSVNISNAAHTVKLSVSGSTFEVFLDGVSQGTWTDSTYSTGQYIVVGANSAGIGYTIDNLSGGL